MKRLAGLAPDLDIFGSQYVLRDDACWQITEAGHALLASVEMSASVPSEQEIVPSEVIVAEEALVPTRQSPAAQLRLVADNGPAMPRARREDRATSSAVA